MYGLPPASKVCAHIYDYNQAIIDSDDDNKNVKTKTYYRYSLADIGQSSAVDLNTTAAVLENK